MAPAARRTPSPYETALQDAFLALDPEVRRAHLAPLVAVGNVDVEHGSHWLAQPLIRILRLPTAGRLEPVRLDVTRDGDELVWSRRIGSLDLRTRQRAAGSGIEERVGPGTIVFDLIAENGALRYRQTSFKVARIPVPPAIAPQVDARVSAEAGGWRVDVRVTWRTHLVCRYAGRMTAA